MLVNRLPYGASLIMANTYNLIICYMFFITAFRYCCGVHPSIFLNQLLKFCGCWNPIFVAISFTRCIGFDSFALAISNILPCISFSAETPVASRTRSLK